MGYFCTTQDLSTALMKSAGAANVYGVSLENTLGFATAIGQVTRESGKFLPPLLAIIAGVSFKLLESP
ncbi:hypothetical protein [Cytobacillus gottheilii]|uniref:hypothetical protein n=1 Tax=Cytobacillus gottheilii TaxID=859144 RepID=UPI001C5758F2|nr:hypothetical protein [Cytobacillus gottheilii]